MGKEIIQAVLYVSAMVFTLPVLTVNASASDTLGAHRITSPPAFAKPDVKRYDLPHAAMALNDLALRYHAAGEYAKAKPLYERAMFIALVNGQRELLWRIQFNLSFLLAKEGNPDAAIFFGTQAVDTIRALRTQKSDKEREIRKSFLKTKFDGYKFLAGLLIDQGRIGEAQQVLDMKKEEEYFDFMIGL